MNNMFVGEDHLCIQQHTMLNTSLVAFCEEIQKLLKKEGHLGWMSLLLFTHHFAHRAMGPYPIQLVVPSAVTKAVSAATITFTTTSIIRFFFITLNFEF